MRDSASPTVLSPWEDVVRVMTIHKSKGLEFPVVFVMGLEESFSARRGAGLAMHPRLGVALPYVNPDARTTGDSEYADTASRTFSARIGPTLGERSLISAISPNEPASAS